MSGRKYALIIANTKYSDPGLAQLTAPGKDAEDLAKILNDPGICGFDEVRTVLNEEEHVVRNAIDGFLDEKHPEDLLLLYFSGHGIRDERGTLYLAVRNTNLKRLRVTAIKSDFIRETMDQTRSRRQVLILDCCNSGAFAQGTKSAVGTSVGTATAFDSGYGRIILTASDSTQFAWEGDKIIGNTQNSLFTHFLVKGLLGEADRDGNGQITVDELYDYAYEQVKLVMPTQTPSKFSSKQQGEIVLRKNIRMEDIKPAPLPAPLFETLENPYSEIRMAAVQQLVKIMDGNNLGMARSAKEKLEHIANNDDSRTVSLAALEALKARNKEGGTSTPNPIPVPIPPNAGITAASFWKKIRDIWSAKNSAIQSVIFNRKIILAIAAIAVAFVAVTALAFQLRIITNTSPTPVRSSRVPNIFLSDSLESRNSVFGFSGGEDVYSHLDLRLVSAGTKFRAMWYYRVNFLGDQAYVLVSASDYVVQENDADIYFFINNPVFRGTYRVELYMGEQLVGVKHFSYR
jgi:hypothetical protein